MVNLVINMTSSECVSRDYIENVILIFNSNRDIYRIYLCIDSNLCEGNGLIFIENEEKLQSILSGYERLYSRVY